jgi:hypothetical protein
MRKLLTGMAFISLFWMPIVAYGQSYPNPTEAPPVAQVLVREGDFAMKLADALKVGEARNEAEAETMLTSVGIAPANGWMADYPVTPDIIGELQTAIGAAGESNQLATGKDEAVNTFQTVASELGLPFTTDTTDAATENTQPVDYNEYTDPAVINNYYYNEGPPVVTYYPPPPDYYYLYAWVPSPFWSAGFFFPGFFVLNDFHTIVVINNRRVVCSNHFIDPKTHRVGTIHPETRAWGRHGPSAVSLTRPEGFSTVPPRKGGEAILNRSLERARPASASRGVPPKGQTPPAPATTRQWTGRSQGRPESGFVNRQQAPAYRQPAPARMPASPQRSFRPPPQVSYGPVGGRSLEGSRQGAGSFGGGAGRGASGGGCRGRC